MQRIKKQIPNLLTLANLLCGTLMIISAFQLQFVTVAWLAVAALAFDFLDGTAARLLGVSSPMGKELDSMADMVSFGVAPALVLYNYWENERFGETSTFDIPYIDDIIPFFPLVIAAFAGYRLAKFNISEQSNDYFQGLPTPALALACFALPLAAEQHNANIFLNYPLFIILFSLVGGILLVSKIKLFSLKIGSKNRPLNRLRIVLVVVCVGLVISLHFVGAFLCLMVYILFSLFAQKIIT
ncbi:MAG: CDP-alcohol phosphatidyltransferase family protein [Bacteroidia bacterium]